MLDSQRSLIFAQALYTRTSRDLGTYLIAFYKAIGGGWEARTESDFIPVQTKQTMRKRTDWGQLLETGQQELPDQKERRRWRFPDW